MAKHSPLSSLPLPDRKKDRPGSWGYASGRIWCLEKDLFGRSGLDRLYAASSSDEVRRLLLEHRYPQKDAVEDMVMAERCQVYERLGEMVPDDGFWQIFLLPADVANIKTGLKLSILGEDPGEEEFESRLTRPSLVGHELLWQALIREDTEACACLPPWAGLMVQRAREAYAQVFDPAAIDRSLDRDLHSLTADLAADLQDPWLTGYYDRVRDLHNLEALLRARHRRISREQLTLALLPEGLIGHEALLGCLGADDACTQVFSGPYRELAVFLGSFGEKGGPRLFAREKDGLLAEYMRQGLAVLSGAPRVIAFVMAREFEFKNIRIALAGLENGLDETVLQPLRRDFNKN